MAALLFYWDPMNKQVRIEGSVEFLPDSEADEYFSMRPKKSQLGAAASDQSQVVDSRETLIQRYNELEEKYADVGKIPKPCTWGGIRIIPHSYEFWQGQSSRLHDRIVFRKSADSNKVRERGYDDDAVVVAGDGESDGWIMERLQP